MRNLFVFLFVLSAPVFAQPIVFNKVTNQVTYSTNLINSGKNFILCYSGFSNNGLRMAFADSLGVIYKNIGYGTDSTDWLRYARKIETGDILFCGNTFLFDTNQLGYYKGYVVIADTLGNLKRKFPLFRNSTLFNYISNGIFLDNNYYFTGLEYDESQNNNTNTNIFCCKTDTLGNLLWYKSYPQFNTNGIDKIAFEYTYNHSSLLIGASIFDSIVGNHEYWSYLMMQTDTSGNFINRIDLPEFSSNFQVNGITPIFQISRIFNDKYLVLGRLEYYILNNGLAITDSVNFGIFTGRFVSKNFYDASYIVGSLKSFKKVEDLNEIFTKDLSSEPDMISLQDIIPTYDGGHLALIHQFGGTRYIKMDCQGNYVNPIYCWPSATGEQSKIDLKMSLNNEVLSTNNQTAYDYRARLFDIQGRPVQRFIIKKGISRIALDSLVKGVYIIAVYHENSLIGTEKIVIN
jgi:hypothetical protein